MNTPLRILHLEDDVNDTELTRSILQNKGISSDLTRVETEKDFLAALKRNDVDLILADYDLPSFDGLSALKLAQMHAPHLPFIFVSGKLGEDVAIEALKTGATDYVLKTRLGRLAPSVARALREAREKSERKQTQEQLNREQQRFMDLVNSVDGIVWEANAGTFAFSFVSEQAERILGYPIERWLKEPTFWKDHLHPEDRDWAVEFCLKATAEKRNHDFEYRMIGADGRTVWFHDVVTVVVEGDRPKTLRGVLVNTTERKRAEAAVRRSEKELRDVFETIPAMVWRSLPDGTVDFMNHRWQEVTGLPREQALGWNWAKVLHPDDRERVFAGWESAIKTGQAVDWENRVRGADGQYRSWFVRNVPLRDEHGKVVKWYGTAIDIEDRKRAEEAVRRSEKQLRDLIETIPAMAFVTRPDGSNEFVSRKWIEFSGLSAEQSAGSGWEKTLHPDDVAEHLGKWHEALASGQPAESEARHHDVHGNYRWLLVRAVPLRDEQGNIRNWYGTAIDIEDRKRAEALLAGEKRILEMVAKGDSLPQILSCLCQLMEEQTSGVLASVLLLEGDRLRHGGAPSLPKVYTDAIDGTAIGPYSGSFGTAAYNGKQVIVEDIATDPLWTDYRDAALPHGLRACWSTPIFSSRGKVIATFAMYYREPRSPTLRDQQIIGQITHLAGIAIERDRAEQALRASEHLARSHIEIMMRSLDVLATEAAPEKFIGEMLRTIEQHLSAMRVLLWLRDQHDDSLSLHIIIEKGQEVPPHSDHPFVKDPHAWKKLPAFFHEMLLTKSPLVFDDIERDSRISPELREYMTTRGCKKFMAVPMLVSGDLRGFIGIQHVEKGTYRGEEIELAQALAHHVMLAVHGAELAEQRRHAVILEERTRMARDIHDTLAQGFTGVIVQLDTAVEALRDEEPEASAEHIGRARELARESLTEARRSVHALRPQALERAELAEALKAIITNTTAGTSLYSDFQLNGEPRKLQPAVEENLLHIGQEALTNALKHACATRFQARLSFDSDAVRLELCDNGRGFVVDSVNGRGIGLIGMKERAQQIGATLAVTSKPGNGTTIVAVSAYPGAVTT
jgi:PAS domain S-box-containing protein